jgi:hypothetical protein
MKTHQQVVQLSTASEDSTVVKTCALFTFRALRTLGEYIAEIPAVATQAATDIAEAWEESSRPNA